MANLPRADLRLLRWEMVEPRSPATRNRKTQDEESGSRHLGRAEGGTHERGGAGTVNWRVASEGMAAQQGRLLYGGSPTLLHDRHWLDCESTL